MSSVAEIFGFDHYLNCKGFHCHTPHLDHYFIKTLGVDLIIQKENKTYKLCCQDSIYRQPNEKFLILIGYQKKRKKRRTKTKIKLHEIADTV